MRIAVAGKGGSGKSVVAGTLARMLARRGHRVAALDSDTLPGLAISLGLGPRTDALLLDAAEQDDKGRWRLKKGIGPATAIRRFSLEAPDGVRLLQFGKSGTTGMRPIMGSLNAFHQEIHRLADEEVLEDWTIIGDLPAGPRQTAFNWAPYADLILVVVEPTWQSALTARRIARIARSRRDVSILFIGNKVRKGDEDVIKKRIGEPLVCSLPLESVVRDADRRGVALLDHAPSSRSVERLEMLASHLEDRKAAKMRP